MTIIYLFSTKSFVLFKIKDPFQIATILQTRHPRWFLKSQGNILVELYNFPIYRYFRRTCLNLTSKILRLLSFYFVFTAKLTKKKKKWAERRIVCCMFGYATESTDISSVFTRFVFFFFFLIIQSIHDISSFRFARFIVYIQS